MVQDKKTSVHTLWEYTGHTAYYEPPDVLLNQYFIQDLLESLFVVKGFHETEVFTCPGNRDCRYLYIFIHNITLNLPSFQAVYTPESYCDIKNHYDLSGKWEKK